MMTKIYNVTLLQSSHYIPTPPPHLTLSVKKTTNKQLGKNHLILFTLNKIIMSVNKVFSKNKKKHSHTYIVVYLQLPESICKYVCLSLCLYICMCVFVCVCVCFFKYLSKGLNICDILNFLNSNKASFGQFIF